MATLQFRYSIHLRLTPKPRHHYPKVRFSPCRKLSWFPDKIKLLNSHKTFKSRNELLSLRCAETETNDPADEQIEKQEDEEEKRTPFDINLAVILAGFAFEAYASPPEKTERREIDAAGCTTVFLSELFVREIYDGQLFIKLKRGFNFPALDPWGTSDPYVVMELNGQVAKSKTKWGTTEPTWNDDFIFNMRQHSDKVLQLQVAAWDANLVTPHKRMGNAVVCLQALCDGSSHGVLVELEGMRGGGKIELEVRYKTFEEIAEDEKRWRIPFLSELFQRKEFQSLLKIVDSEAVPARQFVEFAFGQLKSLNDASVEKIELPKDNNPSGLEKDDYLLESDMSSSSLDSSRETSTEVESSSQELHDHTELVDRMDENLQTEKDFWSSFADLTNETIVQKFGFSSPKKFKWDGLDNLNKIGIQSRKIAEARYIESGLATPGDNDTGDDKASGPSTGDLIQSSLPDLKKGMQELLQQTDSVLGALMVLKAVVPKLETSTPFTGKDENKTESTRKVEDDVSGSSKNEKLSGQVNSTEVDDKKAEEMKALFISAESAMEAWAMLAHSLGQPSFIKSEFEKICFLDNEGTDTQVAIWRDSVRKRLVIAFRGTEQTKLKDLWTDLMVLPAGLNPERIGGDFKQEVQVHSGFLGAFDSVRTRIISLLKLAIGYMDNVAEPPFKWHVYVTGHSLGGALATLLALELASSQLARQGRITVTMYNFGSPRVGNKHFAELYNQKVKDSWRVVNHRDIIPTVPRLMGYCHVAQPVYLAAGELSSTLENMELSKDGYHGDLIGEATPDTIVNEFMKGEKELIGKILQTEINIFMAIRDGSALMQHMEDFYYVTLLENVRSYYQAVGTLQSDERAAESFKKA